MKQFSNKQRVCKNKTKRHNKRNKTRKGGAPTKPSCKKNFTTPRIPSPLKNCVTKKNTRYGVMTVGTAHGKNPDQGIKKGHNYDQRYFYFKDLKEKMKKKKPSLYDRISSVFTSKQKPHKPKKFSLLEEVLRSTSGKAAMKATSDV